MIVSRAVSQVAALVLAISGAGGALHSADLTARDIAEKLYHAEASTPLDLSGRNLEGLELSGLDFKGARLAGTNLFGSDLSNANLTGANLKGAMLDRFTIIGAKLDGADLSGASINRPSAHPSIETLVARGPSFVGANLKGARVFGGLKRTDFTRANLEGAFLAPLNKTGFIEVLFRTELDGATLTGANMKSADLSYVSFAFADLREADLSGANLSHADLSRADLTGADLSNTNLEKADLDGAILKNVKGLATAKGLAEAFNRDKAIE